MKLQFPPDFNWGVATTAIQIEGGWEATGRGPSMWQQFAAQPGHIAHGDTPRFSARSYEHAERDLDACAGLNLTSYNFSPSWPRLLPAGKGAVNQSGLDYYSRLIDGLLERGIQPDLSLYDWDLPLSIVENGGWARRDTVERFLDYTDLLVRSFGDRVNQWMTFNEISTQATNGYKSGNHAPGIKDKQRCLRAYHHLLLAHGRAVRRLREKSTLDISVVDNLLRYYPESVTDADRKATERQYDINSYYLLDALFKGEMRESFVRHYEEVQGCTFDHVRPGDLEVIASPVDKFGVNYFTSFSVADDPDRPGKAEVIKAAPGPQSPFGWTIDPHGLLIALRELRTGWTDELPLFIGECGIGNIDYPRGDGWVPDPERIHFLRQHLEKVHQAIQEGIPVKGFYVWSLMDNFEWDDGYQKRFGLYYTKYDDPGEYLIKDSGRWYAELCRTGILSN